jgi:membrane fusion protein, multidrug efflux system
MNKSRDDEDELPGAYRYRYKYLYKYGETDEKDDGKQDEGNEQHKDKDQDKDDNKDKQQDDKKKKRKRIIVLSIIGGVFVLVGLIWLLLYIFVFSLRETTDDAYVRGDLVTISPRVPGTVVEIAVDETERVHAGQVLVRLDPADAQVALMNAAGQLAQAVRDAQQSVQQAAEADAVVMQREAQYQTQLDQYQRRFPLEGTHAVAPEEVFNANREMRAAMAALEQARRQAAAAHARVDGTDVHTFPAVIQARSQFRNAWINNNRNAIVSPIDGYASRRQVQVGQRVQPGQDLLTIVPLSELWIDANFKETQLQNIRIGQPVSITTDIYSHVTYHGKVIGFNAGTGAAFSLLPPENATGNWIKVVQRLPVRVSIDARELAKHPLWVGLSTYVDVDTHDRNGRMLSDQIRHKPLMSTDVYEREVREADQHAEAIIRANLVNAAGKQTGNVALGAH